MRFAVVKGVSAAYTQYKKRANGRRYLHKRRFIPRVGVHQILTII